MDASNVQVRRAAPADVPALFEITKEAFRQYAAELGLPDRVTALKETTADIARELASKRVYIATLDGEPVGSVRVEVVGGIGYITRFGVKLAAQGCGVGRIMLDAVKSDARALGIHLLALHTATRMFTQMRFYYANGFYVHSTRNERGYIRGLLLCDLSPEAAGVDLRPVWDY